MQRSTWLLLGFVAWLAAFGYQVGTLYPQLPERVASHFDLHGRPDGWSGKSAFLWMHGVTTGVVLLLFPAFWALIPRLPSSMINVPNKAYWLAPERRGYTVEVTRLFLLWIGHMTAAFLFVLMQLTLRTNLHAEPRLPAIGWIVGLFVALILIPSGWFWWRFRRPAFT